jgi:hypothetical protein
VLDTDEGRKRLSFLVGHQRSIFDLCQREES